MPRALVPCATATFAADVLPRLARGKESTMKRLTLPLILLIVPALATPAPAQLFSQKSRPDPNLRVPELLYIVKMDKDERKRSTAAQDLRDFDIKSFPEIVPILVDVLQNDKHWSVRLEAAQSLGKIRPISQVAGQALERASSQDASLRVRMQAWTSLRLYHLAGYRGQAPAAPAAREDKRGPGRTDEPPLADPVDVKLMPPEQGVAVEAAKGTKPGASAPAKGTPTSNPRKGTGSPHGSALPPGSTAPQSSGPARISWSTTMPPQPVRVTPPPMPLEIITLPGAPATSPPQAPPSADGPQLVPPG